MVEWGQLSIDWWDAHVDNVERAGSLVVSMQRDSNELRRFARLTDNHQLLQQSEVAELEPDLGEQFSSALWYRDEAHLNPRLSLQQLLHYVEDNNGQVCFGQKKIPADCQADMVVDCRGFAAQPELSELRGVKGEMLILQTTEVSLSRPVRLLHPRFPLYIVPRQNHQFMVGATMVESEQRHRISARSLVELLNAAYALHPAFAEAEVVETGVDVRPAYPDNLPALKRRDNVLLSAGKLSG